MVVTILNVVISGLLLGGLYALIAMAAETVHVGRAVVWFGTALGGRNLPYHTGAPRPGIAILLIKQNVRKNLEIPDRAYVLENGRIVAQGKSKKLLQNDHIKKAYWGL